MHRSQARVISMGGLAGARSRGLAGVTDIDLNTRSVIVGRWISTTGTAVVTAANMRTELERLGQATSTLPTRDSVYNGTPTGPYTTILREVREWRRYISDRGAWIRSAYFYALDTTVTGGTGQDAATVAAIKVPATPSEPPVRATYQQSELPVTWMPNHFSPKITVDGRNILANSAEMPVSAPTSVALASIGQTLPVIYDDIYFRLNSSAARFDIEAAVLQWIAATSLYQRYPVVCEIEFLI
jgi:hypothetical protein